MARPIISVRDVSKRYRMGKIGATSLRDELQRWWRQAGSGRPPSPAASADDFWALSEINFDVEAGQVLGIVGRNGAGKSTLLKILSRITEPTTGEIHLRGRLSSLLEVGTGFHPELSGRENIYLNGAVLGMTKAEITRKFDEIVEFSEIGRFLDTPVKRYSSGMYVRLAFGIAAHLDPEILIVDEVLAVGDAEFQRKCINKIDALRQTEGRTILFVSHNADIVSRLCSHCILLERGQVAASGPTAAVMALYHGKPPSVFAPGQWVDLSTATRVGSQQARFSRVRYHNIDESPADDGRIYPRSRLRFELELTAQATFSAHSLALTLYSPGGAKLMNYDTLSKGVLVRLQSGVNRFELRTDPLPLNAGTYTVGFWLEPHRGAPPADWIESAFQIEVAPPPAENAWAAPHTDGHVLSSFEFLSDNDDANRLSLA